MVLKIIGTVLIISVCGFIGFEMSDALKMRVKTLSEFESSMLSFENYIDVLHMPLEEIYNRLAKETEILKDFYKGLAMSDDNDTEKAWHTQLENITHINDGDRRVLTELASTLGKCDIVSQLSSIQLARRQLCENLLSAKEKYAADAKMYKTMSLFTGVGIAVLLM